MNRKYTNFKVNQQQIQAEFRRQQAIDPSLQSAQFSIKFGEEVIFMRQELMLKKNGLPIYNPEAYLRQNHPEKVQAFCNYREHREGEIIRNVDIPLDNRRRDNMQDYKREIDYFQTLNY